MDAACDIGHCSGGRSCLQVICKLDEFESTLCLKAHLSIVAKSLCRLHAVQILHCLGHVALLHM